MWRWIYLAQDSIAVVGQDDATHRIENHLSKREEMYAKKPYM